MTTDAEQLIEEYASEGENAPACRASRSTWKKDRRFARTRRKSGVSLGINGRGKRRSTVNAMHHGKIRE